MSRFSTLERRISGYLSRSPRLRATLKSLYQRVNFAMFAESGFSYELADGVTLSTPGSLIDGDELSADVAEFFGYYDVSPWSPDECQYVVNQVSQSASHADIVIYNFESNSKRKIASTETWTWQQGAMPRWFTLRGTLFLAFNAMEKGTLGTRICSPNGDHLTFLPLPLQALNEPFRKLYSVNYLRLAKNGTEYGYAVRARNLRTELPDDEDGVWSIELEGGRPNLIVSIADLIAQQPRNEMRDSTHEVNHIAVAPDGKHFVFIHRFRGQAGLFSRLYVAGHDGSEMKLLLDDDVVSHFTWLNADSILVWARTHRWNDGYYAVNVNTGDVKPFPRDDSRDQDDGHPSHHPKTGLIVTDSYPDRARQHRLYTIGNENSENQTIGRFLSPPRFSGSDRIDLHPRWNPTGKALSIDAGFSGIRRNYILGLSNYKRG